MEMGQFMPDVAGSRLALTRLGDGCLRCVAADSFPPRSGESDSVCGATSLRRTMEVCMANVADRIVETLEAANVSRIYGLVGDSLNGITESLRVREKIEWIAVRHEEVAAFAAGAQAQLTGELAVCAGSCGPGNLHLINGLFDCHRNRVPVVAIAAHIPSTEIGSSYFQETHPQVLFKECSHYAELISDPAHVPRIVETAIREAISKQGVSVIVISGDVALKEALGPAPTASPVPRLPHIVSDE